MVLVSIFFTDQIHGRIISRCSLFIFVPLHTLALHLAVKILLQIFLLKNLEHVVYIHLSVVMPSRMPAGPHFVATNTIKWKHSPVFDINHQQNTRRSDQIGASKNDNANYAPSYPHGRFYQWLRLPFFKRDIRSSAKNLDCELFYSELKRHNVSHYIYLSSHHEYLHIVLKTITPCYPGT